MLLSRAKCASRTIIRLLVRNSGCFGEVLFAGGSMFNSFEQTKVTPKVVLILVGCLAAYVYIGCKPVWQFDHLEQNARRVITGPELQLWATNLLVRYPVETNFSLSQLGTNFPQQLRALAPKLGPNIFVHVYDDPSQPSYVQIYWGSGFLGAAGFLIGPTNFFVAGERKHAWQPGVYFYRM